jgi:hypothetical protein
MNSLREEIHDIMKERGDDWRRNRMRDFDINDRYTDKIISMIEKRIDSMELWCGECNDKALDKVKDLLK